MELDKQKRNICILKRVLDGNTLAKVGLEYGVSTERARGIIFKLCRQAHRNLKFHFNDNEWEYSLDFYRKQREFIYAALKV